jgi:HD-GYP domain-containing protein (c-di-GMP phosphodiesterase class II)
LDNSIQQIKEKTREENKKDFLNLVEKGKGLVNLFHSTLKTALLYEPNNEAFRKQILPLMDSVKNIIEEEGELSLSTKEGYLFLNQARLRFDFENYVATRFIIEFFQKLKLYKLTFETGLKQEELQTLIYILVQIDPNEEEPYESLEKKIFELNLKNLHLEKEKEASTADTEQVSLDQRKMAKKTFFKAISVVRELSQRTHSGKEVNLVKVKRLVQTLVDQILQNEEIFLELSSLKNFDEYTYIHSTNVCIYSLVLGLRVGLSKRELSELGLAALFHDIGKVKLPLELLNKPAEFNESEWMKMRKHPIIGVKNLLASLKLDPFSIRAMLVSFEHHLNLDLSGYPELREKREMNLFSRIVSIADAYDAMTSGRVYVKTPYPPDEALRKMYYSKEKVYDHLLLKFFINMLGVYPVGSLVLLRNGEVGIVIKNNPENLSAPKVKIIADQKGMKETPEIVDLSKIAQVSAEVEESNLIVRCLDPQQYDLDISKYIL